MCGRFKRRTDKQKVAKVFEVTAGLNELEFDLGDDPELTNDGDA